MVEEVDIIGVRLKSIEKRGELSVDGVQDSDGGEKKDLAIVY